MLLTRRFSIGFLLALLTVGCSQKEELGIISGRVTSHGKPVRDVDVVFRNFDKGVHILATVDEEGKYRVFTAAGNGLPLGPYQVCVSPIDPPPVGWSPDNPNPPAGILRPKKRTDIPAQFLDVRTSNLAVTIEKGTNEFDIDFSQN